jgi:hypothetical protein
MRDKRRSAKTIANRKPTCGHHDRHHDRRALFLAAMAEMSQ